MSPAHLPNQPLSMIVAIYKAGGKEGNSWYHTGESPATLTINKVSEISKLNYSIDLTRHMYTLHINLINYIG